MATFDKTDPTKINLDIDFVEKLESSIVSTEGADALSFLMGITIMHEFVHYGDYNYQGDLYRGSGQEEGYWYEYRVYGQIISTKQDALLILKRSK